MCKRLIEGISTRWYNYNRTFLTENSSFHHRRNYSRNLGISDSNLLKTQNTIKYNCYDSQIKDFFIEYPRYIEQCHQHMLH